MGLRIRARLRSLLRQLVATAAFLVTASAAHACPALLSYTFQSLVADKPVDLCRYEGKVVLVVNTASHCGYTPQYAGLEALYRKYKGKGLVILGFPANDFGQQEPGSNGEIAKFCEENFGVSFPMFAKGERPLAANPLYAKLIAATGAAPKWNFHKYLIDRRGARVASFDSGVEPESRELVRAVESALGG
jgi:glutathione peroxidase